MTRFITVGAAQTGPVGRNESRAAVVVRLLELMREAKSRGCDLVVFTECALTPFFPRWWEEDLDARDKWFEREMPGPGTHLLFNEAKKLGIGFHLGYAELAEENGQTRHYNTSILVGPDGQILGKYRKIHLPGLTTEHGENPHRCYEKHYFDVGNLGFKAWRVFGSVVGMCLGNDRRWPETYRVLGLQGAELIVLGYNTAADHPDHPELDHLTNFHSMLTMQAGAYQNGCYIVGVAKAGNQEGINQIGRSAIISPSGEVVTQCTSLGDELIVHRCNLDQTRLYKDHIFNFAAHRQIEAYSLITETRGGVEPQKPLTEGQALANSGPIQKLLTEDYGYAPEYADQLANRAKKALELAEPHVEASSQVPASSSVPSTPKKARREKSADPLQAVRDLLADEYHYPSEKIEPIVQQASRALELEGKGAETPEAKKPESKPKPKSSASDILAKARAGGGSKSQPSTAETKEALPDASPVAEDIGWLPGRFSGPPKASPDRVGTVVNRLVNDYRYSEELARQAAELAETAWRKLHGTDDLTQEEPGPEEPPATTVFVSEDHPEIELPGRNAQTPDGDDAASTSNLKTVPALPGEEALRVFSVFEEKYGYKSAVARGLAERAFSAWKHWETAQAATRESSTPSVGKEKPVPVETTKNPIATVKETTDPKFVVVPCPECNFQLKIDRENFELLGRKARCPNCQFKFRLPEAI